MIVSSSYISNAFVGLHYGRIYQLDDGSAWKIIDVRCRLGSQIRPKATVRKRRDDYLLKVAGTGLEVEVIPVESPRFVDPIKPLPRRTADFQEWVSSAIQTEIGLIKQRNASRSNR